MAAKCHQSALQKSRIDRATTRPTGKGAGVEQWDGAVRCVSVDPKCCLALWSRCFMGGSGVHSTRLGGFALERSKRKKTTEARYTTKK